MTDTIEEMLQHMKEAVAAAAPKVAAVEALPHVEVEPPLAEKATYVPPVIEPIELVEAVPAVAPVAPVSPVTPVGARVIPSDASSMDWADAQACIARGQRVARPGWHWGSTTLSQSDLDATDWRVVG